MKTTTIEVRVNGINNSNVTTEEAAKLISGHHPHRGDEVKLGVKFSGFGGYYALTNDSAIATIMLGQALKHNRYWGMNLDDNQFSLNDKMVKMTVVKNGKRYDDVSIEDACRLTYACRPWNGDEFNLYLAFSSFGGHYALEADDAIAAIQMAHDIMTGQWWADMSKKSA